jgi:uncharacterized coiled-coil DUF342 family protein
MEDVEKIKEEIISLQQKARELKEKADKLLLEAQNISAERLDVLETIDHLLKEYRETRFQLKN